MAYFFALFFVLFLAGCSTFSERECQTMNWLEKGRGSAQSGETRGQGLAYFEQECRGEHGIEPNSSDFQKGYDAGLKEFCTPANLQQFAASGGIYRGTCPKSDEDQIEKSVQTGRLIFLEKEVSRLQGENSRLKSEVDDLNRDLGSCLSRKK